VKASEARRLALSFPEANEEPHFDYVSFRIKGKIFATMPPDGLHLHVFVDDDTREQALTLHADCAEKLLWGAKAVGVRIDLTKAKQPMVAELLANAWKKRAPKRLLAGFDAGQDVK
jgi:hypothetical protein